MHRSTSSVFALLIVITSAADAKNLPRKRASELGKGQKIAFALADLEKGTELRVRGPAALACTARRDDPRGARFEMKLEGTQETINLIMASVGVAALEVPKGTHAVELLSWSAEGVIGAVTCAVQVPGFKPELPAVIPIGSVVRVTNKPKVVGDDWEVTSAAPVLLRAEGPRIITFEVRRELVPGAEDAGTRLLVARDGKAMMSALIIGEHETMRIEVPVGTHTLSLRADKGQRALLRLK